jgi:hypothetical protein
MNVKIISGFICIALFGAVVNGQVRQPHSLYFMNTIPQVTQMNPAAQPRANVHGILPANVNVDILNDLAVKDILQKRGNKWYSPIEEEYDYAKLRKFTGKKATMFNEAIDLDLLGFGFRFGDGYFSFGLSEHVSVNNALPTDLFKVTENGFPDKSKLDFSPMRTQAIGYMQFLIGYSHKINERLTVGMNVKPLLGQAAVATKIQKININTRLQQWDADVKGNVYSSAPVEIFLKEDNRNKIDNIEFRDFDDYESRDWVNYGMSFNNPGIAFDLGAEYQLDERIMLSASLNNLGFISWKSDLNSVSFDGKYTFDGVYSDVSEEYGKDEQDFLNDLWNELEAIVDYRVKHDKFSTPLAPVLHVGASYSLSKSLSAGFLSRTVFWKNAVRQSFNLSAYLQPYSFVSVNAGLTYQVKGNVYLGGGLMFQLGPLPLQVYILTDYLPVFYSTSRTGTDGDVEFPVSERQKSFTVRAGLNLTFGRHGYTNRPMLDKGKSSWN